MLIRLDCATVLKGRCLTTFVTFTMATYLILALETCIQAPSNLPIKHEVQVVAQLALAAEVFASRRYVHDQMSIDFEKRRSVGPCEWIRY